MAVAPDVGTTLAQADGDGRVNVISNLRGRGFTVVRSLLVDDDDQSTATVFAVDGAELTSLSAGSFTGECGAADVVTGGVRRILTQQITIKPQAGVEPESRSLALTAWSAVSGERLWSATLISRTRDEIGCEAFDGNLQNFSATADGRWGAVVGDDVHVAVRLSDGKLYPRTDLLGVIGSQLAIGTDHTYYEGKPNRVTLAVPPEWTRRGTFRNSPTGQDGIPLGQPVFAPTGELANQGYSDAPAMQTTADGKTLIGVVGDSSYTDHSYLVAYALPSARKIWSVEVPEYATYTMAGISDHYALVADEESSDTTLLAFDIESGSQRWKTRIESGQLCDLTSTQVMVSAGDQLATLRLDSGKQLSYAPNSDGDKECPTFVATGLSGVGYNDGEVKQLLDP